MGYVIWDKDPLDLSLKLGQKKDTFVGYKGGVFKFGQHPAQRWDVSGRQIQPLEDAVSKFEHSLGSQKIWPLCTTGMQH